MHHSFHGNGTAMRVEIVGRDGNVLHTQILRQKRVVEKTGGGAEGVLEVKYAV